MEPSEHTDHHTPEDTMTTTRLQQLEATRAATMTATPTEMLVASALVLDAKGPLSSDERRVSAWISDELERRGGGVLDDDAFCALLDQGHTYTAALLITFPDLTITRKA